LAEILTPGDENALAYIISEAAAAEMPLEISGAGTKAAIGRPLQTGAVVSTSALTGITLYEPTELVLSARAGTPLAEIETVLAANDQQLAFEPLHLERALGEESGRCTIGAVFAGNLSGSRRILAGAARDHFLGVRAVNGRGEIFKSGGRVMKNVTGYDLCRGLCGSWGTLAVMTDVTMKVLPAAETCQTVVLMGLIDEIAIDAMCAALGTPFEVSAAAHMHETFVSGLSDPKLASSGTSLTALRLENFSSSVSYRIGELRKLMESFGEIAILEEDRSRLFWSDMRELKVLQGSNNPFWRLSVPPKNGAGVVKSIRAHHPACRAVYDWSGGLIWLEVPAISDAGASEVRRAVATSGGHATLIRADVSTRAAVDVFQPLEAGVAALTGRVKSAFDPQGILNPGRMYAGV